MIKIDTLSALSYGGEVLTSFLKLNGKDSNPIKIDKIAYVASPITHDMVTEIKDNNLFSDNVGKVFCFYSNRDFTQTIDVTQSFNLKDRYR